MPCKMQEVLAAGEKLTNAWTSRGALWGASVPAGRPLHVRVQVQCSTCVLGHRLCCSYYEGSLYRNVCKPGPATSQATNSTFQSRSVELSVSCHDSSHFGAFERAFDTSAALATGNVTGKILPSILTVALALCSLLCSYNSASGVSAGLHFALEHSGQASGSFAVTFLHPGIFSLSAVDVRASLSGHTESRNMVLHGPGKPTVAVYPLYVLVT